MQALGAQSQMPINQSQTSMRSEKKKRKLAAAMVAVVLFLSRTKLPIALPSIEEIIREYTRQTMRKTGFSNVTTGEKRKITQATKTDPPMTQSSALIF